MVVQGQLASICWVLLLLGLSTLVGAEIEYADPVGFEDDAQEYVIDKLPVAVFVSNKKRGFTEIKESAETISFYHPQQVLDMIDNLKQEAVPFLLTRLQGTFAYNQDKNCRAGQKYKCGYIQDPNQIELIYDPEEYKVYLFVNKQHVIYHDLDPIIPKYLEVPDHDISFILNSSHSLYSGSEGDVEYNANVNTIISYNNFSLVTDHIFQHNQDQKLKNIYLMQRTATMSYKALVFQLENVYFIPSNQIYGISGASSLSRRTNTLEAYTSPIKLLLNYPSYVRIYRDDELLSSKRYEEGYNYIDTSLLPDGTYHITIVVTDIRGADTKYQQLFIKSSTLPPRDTTLWYFDLGYNQAKIEDNDIVVSSSNYIARIGKNKRISDNFGLAWNFLSNPVSLLFETNVTYFAPSYNLYSGLVIGKDNDYNALVNISSNYFGLNIKASLSKLWYGGVDKSDQQPLLDFSSLKNATAEMSVSGGYKRLRGSFMMRYEEDAANEVKYKYGPLINFNLWNSQQLDLKLELSQISTNLDPDEQRAKLSLGARLGNLNFSHDLRYMLPDASITNNERLGWNYESNYGNFEASFNQQNTRKPGAENKSSYDANVKYASDILDLSHSINNNNAQSTAANLQLNIIAKPTFSIKKDQFKSGILVKVVSDAPNASFLLAINSAYQNIIIPANTFTAIPMPAYKELVLNIEGNSDELLIIEDNQRELVLHPGSVVEIVWQAKLSSIVIGTAVDVNNRPIISGLIEDDTNHVYTDETGFFELTGKWQQPITIEQRNGKRCVIAFPKNLTYDALLMFGNPVCVPIVDDSMPATKVEEEIPSKKTSKVIPDEQDKQKGITFSGYSLALDKPVSFAPSASQLSQSAQLTLDKLATSILEHSELFILEISIAVADNLDTTSNLHELRVQSIYDYLVKLGMPATRLYINKQPSPSQYSTNTVNFYVRRIGFVFDHAVVEQDNLALPDISIQNSQAVFLKGIQFALGQVALKRQDQYMLDKLIKHIKATQPQGVFIVGYTDTHGNLVYNQQLSTQRLKNIEHYLTANGVARDIVHSRIKGIYELQQEGHGNIAQYNNRYVEIYLEK
jgi:outer membrane protein OmpA-like peptidoglycan-associated protein